MANSLSGVDANTECSRCFDVRIEAMYTGVDFDNTGF